MKRVVSIGIVLAACGNSSTQGPHDAAIDSHSIDAPVDAAIDAAPMPAGTVHYIIDHVMIPTTNAQARQYGLDLNADGTVDNQLGMVLAAFSNTGTPVQAGVDYAVDHGTSLQLAELVASSFTTAASATFTLYAGQNPNPTPCASGSDTICRRHLHGTATFGVAATPRDTPLAGAIASGQLTAGPGHLSIDIPIAISPPTPITLIGARVAASPNGLGIMTGVIDGGVTVSDVNTKIYPALQGSINVQIGLDCPTPTSPPGCGCGNGTLGMTYVGLFDTNHDCTVSVDEIKNNSLIQSLFAPDVMLEGQSALSFGFGFTAVEATYVVN